MRTTVVLDDKLVEDAMRFTGLTTKRAVIEEALRLLVRLKSQEMVRSLRRRGITVRNTVDCLITTYVIEKGHTLLHSDWDFDHFAEHLGMSVIKTA